MNSATSTVKPPSGGCLGAATIFFICAASFGASLPARAADPSRGAQLYMRTDTGGRSCVACHGADPGQNHNNILRAADSPATLTKVLNTVSAMGFLRSELSDADRADITAFLGAINRLNGANAALKVWPITADFGPVLAGGASSTQTLRLLNPSRTAPVGLKPLTVSNAEVALAHNCPPALSPGEACDVQLRFTPRSEGLMRAAVTIDSPAFSQPVYAALTGSGASGPLSQLEWQTAEAVIAFNAAATPPVLRRTISLVNRGSMPAVLGISSVTGPDAARFIVESGCAQGSVLQAGSQCDLTLLYSPSLLPVVHATLQIQSNQTHPASLRLEGMAAPAPSPVPGMEMLASGGSGGGCSVGPPSQRAFDPVLVLAALLAAWALGWRRAAGRQV